MSRIIIVWVVCAVFHGVAQHISVDYDHNCDFSRYKTYRWRQLQRTYSPDMLFSNQLTRDRIVSFVEEALAAKHLTRVETGADLLVDYDLQVSVQPQFTTYTDGMGPAWDCLGWGCYGLGWDSTLSITTTQPVVRGTLVVSITDSSRRHLIFQGASNAAVSSRVERNNKRLRKGVNEIFEKYPPR